MSLKWKKGSDTYKSDINFLFNPKKYSKDKVTI